ncbi:MAG: ABC transporter permease [Natronomonas sp.]
MTLRAVVEKDFRDAIRSRLLLGLTGLFVLFSIALAYFVSELDQQTQFQQQIAGELTTLVLIGGFVGPVSIFVPIVAIAASYRAIAGERQSGSLRLLLSLPNDRLNVVVGKFLGRSGVVSIALLIGFGVGLVATAMLTESFSVLGYLAFVAASLLLGFVFVSISVGVSAFTSSTSRAAYGAFGLFIVFEFLWNVLVTGIVYAANGFSLPGPDEELPGWLSNLSEVLVVVDPTTAYEQSVFWVVRRIADDAQTDEAVSEAAFYLQDWFGFVILLLWIAIPLAIGYYRFENADL